MKIELLHYNEQTITHNLLLNNGTIIGQQVTLLHSGTGEKPSFEYYSFWKKYTRKDIERYFKSFETDNLIDYRYKEIKTRKMGV